MTDSAATNNYRDALEEGHNDEDGRNMMEKAQEQWDTLCAEEKLYCSYSIFESIRVRLGCSGFPNRWLNRLKFNIKAREDELLTSENSTRQKGTIEELPTDEEFVATYGEEGKKTLEESKKADENPDDYYNPDSTGKHDEFFESNPDLSRAIDELVDDVVHDILQRAGLDKYGVYKHDEVKAAIAAGGVPDVLATMVIPDPITAFASLEDLYNYRPTFTAGAGAGAGAGSA
ncbi:Hypothetical protein POVN_LOCUS475 [uncultured virus]|nr:Hypothetical protein POVN_LOCUS475 [uncultured virus]